MSQNEPTKNKRFKITRTIKEESIKEAPSLEVIEYLLSDYPRAFSWRDIPEEEHLEIVEIPIKES